MSKAVEQSVLEAASSNSKSLIETIKEAFSSTKVSQEEVAAMRDLAAEVGVKNYKDLFSMNEVKPSSKLERFINAKINKLKTPKKVTSFLVAISSAKDQASLSKALGIPEDKLVILVPTKSYGEIFTDLFKKFLLFTFTYFIFNVALTSFKVITGVKEILSKCASYQRGAVTASIMYRQIKSAGVKRADFDDDLMGGSEVPDFAMDPAEEFEIIDEQMAAGRDALAEALEKELVSSKIQELNEEVQKSLADDFDFTNDPEFLNALSPEMQQSATEMDFSNDPEFLQVWGDLDESSLSKDTLDSLKEEAFGKATDATYSTGSTTLTLYTDEGQKAMQRGMEMANNPDTVKSLAEASGESEIAKVVQEHANLNEDVEFVGPPEYGPTSLQCKALEIASYGAVKILGKFFKSVAKGAFKIFAEYGLLAFLASAFTAMFVFGTGIFGKIRAVIENSAKYVKDLASNALDYIRGVRKLRLAHIKTAGTAALPSEVHSKISLSFTDYIKSKYEQVKKHLNTRDLKNMRELATDVGAGIFTKVSRGEEIKPSNKIEALLKKKLELVRKPEERLEIISAIQSAQSNAELALALGVSEELLDSEFEGVVNTRGWDYSVFIGKTFLFFLSVSALLNLIPILLGFGGSSALVAEVTTLLAPINGVLVSLLGTQKVGVLLAGIAKSSAFSGLLMTAITGLVLYGPRWIRNVLGSVKNWLGGEIVRLFRSLNPFSKAASHNPHLALQYFLQP